MICIFDNYLKLFKQLSQGWKPDGASNQIQFKDFSFVNMCVDECDGEGSLMRNQNYHEDSWSIKLVAERLPSLDIGLESTGCFPVFDRGKPPDHKEDDAKLSTGDRTGPFSPHIESS